MSVRTLLRLRWKRQRLLWRAFRCRDQLTNITFRLGSGGGAGPLAFAVVRNEMGRLAHWLDHHRRLGVGHFLIVDNDSTDGGRAWLAEQPDVSLWTTTASYRNSKFGRDWMNWLLTRYGAGRWCLTLDADELIVFPYCDRSSLSDLTAELDRRGVSALGALMVELYPQGPLLPPQPVSDTEALARLSWFDVDNYRCKIQQPMRNRWVQGGPRDRVFFADHPERAPTLNKLPLVRWRRGYAYVNSTHSMLPAKLNDSWDGPGDNRLSGALLHTKFLPEIVAKSQEERQRRQHFGEPAAYDSYYAALIANPDLWFPGAKRFDGWQSLVKNGLISVDGWQSPTE